MSLFCAVAVGADEKSFADSDSAEPRLTLKLVTSLLAVDVPGASQREHCARIVVVGAVYRSQA